MAQSELERGIAYYEARESGLGEQLFAEVRRVLSLVSDYPEIGAEIWNTRRRLLLDRFPYGIVYRILEDGSIRVLAVMHLRKRPGYWNRRR
ncbi:MAG: type II toxin-antitoxin system RelE/ParE family toxin [Gemmatimonadota bacterium]